jgi:hypothetical protein
MTKPDDNAFPQFNDHPHTEAIYKGLTKREWFAGMAMQGLLANANDEVISRNIPADAVGWADALITELAKEKP